MISGPFLLLTRHLNLLSGFRRFNRRRSSAFSHRPHMVRHHHRDLKGQRIIEHPDIKPRSLLDLFQPVHQRIAVNVKLPCRLRYIQVIIKEGKHCLQFFIIEQIGRAHV